MKLKPVHLAGLVLAGATAATLALLPFMGATPAPEPFVPGAPGEVPAPEEPAAPAAPAVVPPGGGSLSLVRRANLPPEEPKPRKPAVYAPPPGSDPSKCVHPTEGGVSEPPTLPELLKCQEAARRGRTLVEAYVEFQRAEVRGYLSRHPERATTEEPAAPTGPAAPAKRR